jgi:hypothetical protein
MSEARSKPEDVPQNETGDRTRRAAFMLCWFLALGGERQGGCEMTPRPRLTLLAGVAASLSLAGPAIAEVGAGDALSGAQAAPFEYAAPLDAESPSKRAKRDPAPSERQAPPPVPSGCPFRDGKLDLIV